MALFTTCVASPLTTSMLVFADARTLQLNGTRSSHQEQSECVSINGRQQARISMCWRGIRVCQRAFRRTHSASLDSSFFFSGTKKFDDRPFTLSCRAAVSSLVAKSPSWPEMKSAFISSGEDDSVDTQYWFHINSNNRLSSDDLKNSMSSS